MKITRLQWRAAALALVGNAALSFAAAAANRAPVISGTPGATATVGSAYSFTPTGSDPDGTKISFSVWNKPAWATFTASTGRLTGTPKSSDVGANNNIFITVTDGLLNTVLGPFSITVKASSASNRAPTISGTPPSSVVQGTQYAFQPSASDPDGDKVSFAVWNKPAWATFTASTGRLSGTPGSGNVGTTSNIFIIATDGLVNTNLGPFSITVKASSSSTNRAPTISGTPPASVLQGTAYAFQPNATDPDGDKVSFSVWNKPSWATFTASTGRLAGTPGPGDVGTTKDIFVTATDGLLNTKLGPFSITVQAVGNSSATLSWQSPTQNTNGSPLTDLAGFKVYWGTSAGTYPNSVTLNNAGLTSYVVGNLVPGTYYFVMTAFNRAGMESPRTSPTSKAIK